MWLRPASFIVGGWRNITVMLLVVMNAPNSWLSGYYSADVKQYLYRLNFNPSDTVSDTVSSNLYD